MADLSFQYDHPNYTVIRQETKSTADLLKIGMQSELTFRSHVACVVTQISATTGGSAVLSATLILTLLHNGSVAAVLTLEESLNTSVGVFTLTANRTLTAITDRFEVSTNSTLSGDCSVSVCYEYRIVPGSTYSLFGAIA